MRPVAHVEIEETCPTCFGKGQISSSMLFTEQLENKIDYLVNSLKTKRFVLHVHPYVDAYISKGLFSTKRKWKFRYGAGCKVIASQRLAFLQYKFYDTKGNEIDLQEEIEKVS